jgi:hypothetical protein
VYSKIVQIGIAIILLSTITSCLPKDVTKDDLTGVWVEAKYSPSIKKDFGECASIEFLKNERFNAKQLPQEYFIWFGTPPKERSDATGKWELQPASNNDPFTNRIVNLKFDPNPQSERYAGAYESALFLTMVGEHILYGGPDFEIIFSRNAKEWCTEKP